MDAVGVTEKEMAELLGVWQSTVHRWARRTSKARPDMQDQVEDMTGGSVTKRDWKW